MLKLLFILYEIVIYYVMNIKENNVILLGEVIKR